MIKEIHPLIEIELLYLHQEIDEFLSALSQNTLVKSGNY